MSDLLAVIPSAQWDADKDVPVQRRPAKFHFINLSVALTFSPNRMTHEIDFVDGARRMYEVKLGPANPMDFAWFPKVFPKRKLLVISGSDFRTSSVKSITMEQFLLADGFPHPYPKEVEDVDLYNDYARF